MPEKTVSKLLTKLLIMALASALMALIYRWVMCSTFEEPARPTESLGSFIMAPSRSIRYLAFGGTAFFVALGTTFVYVVPPFPKAILPAAMVAALFVFLFAGPALYDLRRRVRVSREGLRSFSPWTGRKSATWSDVESVSFSREWGQTIRIHLRSGGIIGIPCTTMNGLQQLEAAMREQLQPLMFERAFNEYRIYSKLGHGQR